MASAHGAKEPTIENRQARHDYAIEDTLECGIRLTGTEIKSVRASLVSLQEGFVMAVAAPPSLHLHSVHIGVYPPAGAHRQHEPLRIRTLLAHRREIEKLALEVKARGATLVPLKIYFVRGRAKLLLGIAIGRRKVDKRHAIREKEMKREVDRIMRKRR